MMKDGKLISRPRLNLKPSPRRMKFDVFLALFVFSTILFCYLDINYPNQFVYQFPLKSFYSLESFEQGEASFFINYKGGFLASVADNGSVSFFNYEGDPFAYFSYDNNGDFEDFMVFAPRKKVRFLKVRRSGDPTQFYTSYSPASEMESDPNNLTREIYVDYNSDGMFDIIADNTSQCYLFYNSKWCAGRIEKGSYFLDIEGVLREVFFNDPNGFELVNPKFKK